MNALPSSAFLNTPLCMGLRHWPWCFPDLFFNFLGKTNEFV